MRLTSLYFLTMIGEQTRAPPCVRAGDFKKGKGTAGDRAFHRNDIV